MNKNSLFVALNIYFTMLNFTKFLKILLITLVLKLVPSTISYAQIYIYQSGNSYWETFDKLANTGTTNLNSTLPPGWLFTETGTGANSTYAGSNGILNAGNTYSFGSTPEDRALGTLLSTAVSTTIGARFYNSTGTIINSLKIAYTGEQWRSGAMNRGADRLDFQYSLNATSLNSGTYLDINELDFSSPNNTIVGALDGNSPANRKKLSYTISGLSILPGQTFWIRWVDLNVPSADDGLAVDDFSMTAYCDLPGIKALSTAVFEGNTGSTDVTLNVILTQAAGLSGVSFDIATKDSTTTAGEDYFPVSLTNQFIPAGDSIYQFTVTIKSDEHIEEDEIFNIIISNVKGAIDLYSRGAFVILTDDFELTSIPEIQGETASSEYVGREVATKGVVTGNFDPELNGFFIQDITGDGNNVTSDAIFVHGRGVQNVKTGDLVVVTGKVDEYFGLTEITNVKNVIILSSGHIIIPTEISIPENDLERYEGMLVKFPQTLTVSGTENIRNFGEVLLSANGRLYTPSDFIDPNDNPADENKNNKNNIAALDLQQAENNSNTILLDDRKNGRIPEGMPIPYLDPATQTLRTGSTIETLTGILDFSYSKYRIRPTVDPVIHYASRPEVPSVGEANVKVASFNVQNYFTTLGSRGAATAEEFARQKAKIVTAITQLNADVIGIIEIENNGDGPNSAIANLVDGLNAVAGNGQYTYIKDPYTGTGSDLIKTGIIYKPSVVSPTKDALSDRNSVHERFPIAQTFRVSATGSFFNFVVNHFKSRDCSYAKNLDLNQKDGQGCYNETRKNQALALIEFLEVVKEKTGVIDAILVGDYNSYSQEDPIDILTTADLESLTPPKAYSYTYREQFGSLDHALVTPSLKSKITKAEVWHINSDEPSFSNYKNLHPAYANTPFRSSDHDPILIGILFKSTLIRVGFTNPVDTVEESSSYQVGIKLSAPSTKAGVIKIDFVPGQGVLYGIGENRFITSPSGSQGYILLYIQPNSTTAYFTVILNKEMTTAEKMKEITFIISGFSAGLSRDSNFIYKLCIENKEKNSPVFQVFPTQTTGQVQLRVNSEEHQKIKIKGTLRNSSGQLLYSGSGNVSEIQNGVNEQIQKENAGLYLLNIKTEEEKYQLKIIKTANN